MIRPKQPRHKLSQKKYRKLCMYVYERDKWCVFCGRHDDATPAHVIRRSQGGHDSPNNLVRACTSCHEKFDKYELELPPSTLIMLSKEPFEL